MDNTWENDFIKLVPRPPPSSSCITLIVVIFLGFHHLMKNEILINRSNGSLCGLSVTLSEMNMSETLRDLGEMLKDLQEKWISG